MSDVKDISDYVKFDRDYYIFGVPIKFPIFSCEKCHKDNCDGIGECKGYGSYSLGVRYIGN